MLKISSVWEDDPLDFISSLIANAIAIARETKSLPCQKNIISPQLFAHHWDCSHS